MLNKVLVGIILVLMGLVVMVSHAQTTGEVIIEFEYTQVIPSDFAGWQIQKQSGAVWDDFTFIQYTAQQDPYTTESLLESPLDQTVEHCFRFIARDTMDLDALPSNVLCITVTPDDFTAPEPTILLHIRMKAVSP
jgi:hypothetical protein